MERESLMERLTPRGFGCQEAVRRAFVHQQRGVPDDLRPARNFFAYQLTELLGRHDHRLEALRDRLKTEPDPVELHRLIAGWLPLQSVA